MPGRLYLMPNALDLGVEGELPGLDEVLAFGVIRTASRVEHWVVENAKSARAFLKRVDALVPLARPIQQIEIAELPRPPKGKPAAAVPADWDALLAPAHYGLDVALLSEAGLPAVADPGALLVARAHSHAIEVIALPGPNSLMLALAASGLNGQGFEFVGYLPTDAAGRAARIRELEVQSRHDGRTRLMIETPYRNAALWDALVQHLSGSTQLAVGCGLTTARAFSRSRTVRTWRATPLHIPADLPAVFLFLAGASA